jgi:hypothetical protein
VAATGSDLRCEVFELALAPRPDDYPRALGGEEAGRGAADAGAGAGDEGNFSGQASHGDLLKQVDVCGAVWVARLVGNRVRKMDLLSGKTERC